MSSHANKMSTSDINQYIHWLSLPSEFEMAIIRDIPELPPRIFGFSPREIQEGRAKKSAAAYRGWFLGRLAAKAATGSLSGIAAHEVEIIKKPSGQPMPLFTGCQPATCFISISHTTGVAVAVASVNPVGVDIEAISRNVSPRTWRWAFSEQEMSLTTDASVAYCPRLALWCAKEAAAKSWGYGLLNHLNRVRIIGADWVNNRMTIGWLNTGSQDSPSDFGADYPSDAPQRSEVRLIVFDEYIIALAQPAKPNAPYYRRI